MNPAHVDRECWSDAFWMKDRVDARSVESAVLEGEYAMKRADMSMDSEKSLNNTSAHRRDLLSR